MSIFYGTFENRLDGKNRLSVPAKFRPHLGLDAGDRLLLVRSPEPEYPTLFGMPASLLTKAMSVLGPIDTFSREEKALLFRLPRLAEEYPLDDNGRIVLPAAIRKDFDLDRAVEFVGRGPYFEMWAPGAWEPLEPTAYERATVRFLLEVAGR